MPTYRTMMEIVIDSMSVEHAVNITYRYDPGYTPRTPPGEYAPIDPPEPEQVEIQTVTVVDAKTGLETLVPEWIFTALVESETFRAELLEEARIG